MKTLLWAMCLTGTLAFAQTPSIKPESDQVQGGAPTAPDQSTVKPQTVRGCLSSAGDNYTIIDQVSGKTFKLAGNTDRLKQYIGQTVEITGSIKSVDGDSKPATASTGEILTLADVKQVSDKCSSVPQSGALPHTSVLLALMQRPVNDDANTQLNSSRQMSTNAQDTSAAAASTRSVTTNTQERSTMDVAGHTGAHGLSVTTADTKTVGESTPPTSSPVGYAANKTPNDRGIAPVNPNAQKQVLTEADREKQKVSSPALNAEAIGASPQDGNAAAVAATNAEMHTDANGQKTTYPTMLKSEASGSKSNPKVNQPASREEKTKATPTAPQ